MGGEEFDEATAGALAPGADNRRQVTDITYTLHAAACSA